jgi:hypothetical protein
VTKNVISIVIDGETYETEDRRQTAMEVLALAGKSTAEYYLVELKGSHQESYQGRPNDEIHLHPNQKFVTLYIGGHTVSDLKRGVDLFRDELAAMGVAAIVDDGASNRLTFDLEIPGGKYFGRTWRIGVEVPPEFPDVPPSGPHVCPHVHGTETRGGQHPIANIHQSPFGPSWEYWSRPYPNWNAEKEKTAGTYMKHVVRLWVTQ